MSTALAPFARHGRHERLWWKTNQRTVAQLIAEHGVPLNQHFLTAPREGGQPRHASAA